MDIFRASRMRNNPCVKRRCVLKNIPVIRNRSFNYEEIPFYTERRMCYYIWARDEISFGIFTKRARSSLFGGNPCDP